MRDVNRNNKDRKVRRTMLAPRTKVKGMTWEFHKGDNDNQPSVPHGHSQDGKYKLQLWSGNIYNVVTGKLEFRAKKKEMKNLQNYPGFKEFVNECREEYKTRNPAIALPELSGYLYRQGGKRRRAQTLDRYIVFIRHDRV